MRGSTRKGKRAGLALIEVVLVVFALAVVAALVLPRLARPRKESTRIRCRHVLYRLAKGMRMYPNEHGDNAWYPCPLGRGATPGDYNGAEWLASLYWTGIVSDPGVFICPSSPDQNDAGRDIGTHHAVAGRFGSQTVSYAGMYYGGARAIGRAGSFPAALRADYPPDKPMASDDTQGDINHGTSLRGSGVRVLFFDSHVEFRTNTELDLQHAVGDTAPDALLRELRN